VFRCVQLDEDYSVEKMIEMAEQHYGKQCRGVLGCSCDRRLTLDETDDALLFAIFIRMKFFTAEFHTSLERSMRALSHPLINFS
jgi:hypothetical protein